jgi:DNA-binding response OmpR family regulator
VRRPGRPATIEDDPAIRSALIRGLTERGPAVDSAVAALAGLEQVVRTRPDLVVLDLGLPDLDGLLRGASRGTGDRGDRPGRGARAELDGAALDLTPREFDLLHHLAARADQVVSRRERWAPAPPGTSTAGGRSCSPSATPRAPPG